MQLLIVTEHLDVGGVERFAVNLANGFVEAGQQADLFLFLGAHRGMSSQLDKRVNVHTMGLRYFKTVFPLLMRFPTLVSRIKKTDYDLIISAKTIPSVITLAACWLAGKRKKLVITVHENCQDVVRSYTGIRKLFFFMSYRYLYRFAHTLVAVSQSAGKGIAHISGIPAENIHIIYNPVVTRQLMQEMRAEITHPWLVQKQMPVLLAAGRFTSEKNFALLVRAFAQLHPSYPCRLILLGDGEEQKMLTQLAHDLHVSEYVSMPGMVENPYVYMAHADLFVLSSLHEALPTVLIEAMACGCPIVSTDCPNGPREILDNGTYGMLVAVNDQDALASAIRHMLQTQDTIDRGALQRRANIFSQSDAVQRYLQLAAL